MTTHVAVHLQTWEWLCEHKLFSCTLASSPGSPSGVRNYYLWTRVKWVEGELGTWCRHFNFKKDFKNVMSRRNRKWVYGKSVYGGYMDTHTCSLPWLDKTQLLVVCTCSWSCCKRQIWWPGPYVRAQHMCTCMMLASYSELEVLAVLLSYFSLLLSSLVKFKRHGCLSVYP